MKFEIDLKEHGVGSTIKLNGKLIENLEGIEISTSVNEGTRITLHFIVPDEIKGEVESKILEITGLRDEFTRFINRSFETKKASKKENTGGELNGKQTMSRQQDQIQR